MPAIRSARWAAIAAALPLAIVLAAGAAHAANPNALREIVDGQCVPDMQQHADPQPCAEVDLTGGVTRGYAILKDIKGASQFLLIPTDVIDGIESPVLLAPAAVNYFDDAWTARTFVEKALGRTMPRDALSLAVNSKYGRTQNQLHIHIDCIAADVRDALRRRSRPHRRPMDAAWTRRSPVIAITRAASWETTLAGHRSVQAAGAGHSGRRC